MADPKPKVVAAGSTQDAFGNGRRISTTWYDEKDVRVSLKINDLLGKGSIFLPFTRKCKTIKLEEKPKEWQTILTPMRFTRELGIEPQPHHTNKKSKEQRFDDGWLYLFINGYLWRELRVSRTDRGNFFYDVHLDNNLNQDLRIDSGQGSSRVLVPFKVQDEPMKIQVGFSEVQWSWERIESFGGVSPPGVIRRFWYLDEYTDMNNVGKKLREKRLQVVELEKGYNNTYSTTKDNLGPITEKNLYEFKVDLNKKIPAFGVHDPVGDAKDLAFTYQQSFRNIEQFIANLADKSKVHKYPFAPWFNTAVLANQYFFAESNAKIPSDILNGVDTKAPELTDDEKKEKKKQLVLAKNQRNGWQSKLSLNDIQKALGTKERVKYRAKIVESKKKLVEYLSIGSKSLERFVPAVDDYGTLAPANKTNRGGLNRSILYKLAQEIIAQLSDHEYSSDLQLETKVLSEQEIYAREEIDPGSNFLRQLAGEEIDLKGKKKSGNIHPLHTRLFPKPDTEPKTSNTISSKNTDPEEPDTVIQTVDKVARSSRYASQFFQKFLIEFATACADARRATAQNSVVTLISACIEDGTVMAKLHVSYEDFLNGELTDPKLKDYEIIQSDLKNTEEIKKKHNMNKARFKRILKSQGKPATVILDDHRSVKSEIIVRNSKGTPLATTTMDTYLDGKTFDFNESYVDSLDGKEPKWKKFTIEIYVAKKFKGAKKFGIQMQEKGVALKNVFRFVAILEAYNLASFFASAKIHDEKGDLKLDEVLNASSVILDFAAVSAMIAEEKLNFKYYHDKILNTQELSRTKLHHFTSVGTRILGFAAGAVSGFISYKSMIRSYHKGDDAAISHTMLMTGFVTVALTEAVGLYILSQVGVAGSVAAFLKGAPILTFIMGPMAWIGLGLIVIGTILLIWIFKEDTPMEEWLTNNPFAIDPIDTKSINAAAAHYPNGKPKRFFHFGTIFYLDEKGILTKIVQRTGNVGPLKNSKDQKTIYLVDRSDPTKRRIIGKIGEPFDFDKNADRSQRFAGYKGGLKKVDDKFAIWRVQPDSCYDALRSIIYTPAASINHYSTSDPNAPVVSNSLGDYRGITSDILVTINVPHFIQGKSELYVKFQHAETTLNKWKLLRCKLDTMSGFGTGPRTIRIKPILKKNTKVTVLRALIYFDLDGKTKLPFKDAVWTDEQEKLRTIPISNKNIARVGESRVAGQKPKKKSKVIPYKIPGAKKNPVSCSWYKNSRAYYRKDRGLKVYPATDIRVKFDLP